MWLRLVPFRDGLKCQDHLTSDHLRFYNAFKNAIFYVLERQGIKKPWRLSPGSLPLALGNQTYLTNAMRRAAAADATTPPTSKLLKTILVFL